MATTIIHVDKTAGSDNNGKGTTDQPYQTLGFALFAHPDVTAPAQLLIRADPTAAYEEPTKSSYKSARKTADGIEKTRKKQAELAARDAEFKVAAKEKKDRLLEDSRKVVLTEPAGTPAKKVIGLCQ